MYSRKSWGGPVDPFILVKFLNTSSGEVEDPIASLVLFEWEDRDFVGIPDPEGWGNVSQSSPNSSPVLTITIAAAGSLSR